MNMRLTVLVDEGAASPLQSEFGLSLLIELSQLLNHRSSDINDLIMNTLGAVIGFAFYRILKPHLKPNDSADSLSPLALALCIFLPLLGRFFLFHEMGAAKLLYGF